MDGHQPAIQDLPVKKLRSSNKLDHLLPRPAHLPSTSQPSLSSQPSKLLDTEQATVSFHLSAPSAESSTLLLSSMRPTLDATPQETVPSGNTVDQLTTSLLEELLKLLDISQDKVDTPLLETKMMLDSYLPFYKELSKIASQRDLKNHLLNWLKLLVMPFKRTTV